MAKSLFASLAGMFSADVDQTKTDSELHQFTVEQVEALQAEVASLKTENQTLTDAKPEDLSEKVASLEGELQTAQASLETSQALATELQSKLNAETVARAGAEQKRDEAITAKQNAESIAAAAVAKANQPATPDTSAGDGKALASAIDKTVGNSGFKTVELQY